MPRGITTDGKNLYVADSNNNTIRKIVLATGAVTTIAGIPGVTGYADATPGTAATFHWPVGITTDGTNLYVTDSLNNTIRQVVISTTAVTTIAGTAGTIGHADGFGLSATFNVPAGITTDGTNLYVADSNNNTIRQVVISTEAVSTVVGLPLLEGAADGSQAGATFFDPLGITILGTNLYVADTYNDTIREVY
jgi:sugar lactone lactonase YvrE